MHTQSLTETSNSGRRRIEEKRKEESHLLSGGSITILFFQYVYKRMYLPAFLTAK